MKPESRLAAIVIMCVGFPAIGLGQTVKPSKGKEEMEQVVVTGSRVKRPEYEGNIPGVQEGAEQIELRNFNNAVDVLQDIPLVGNGANPNGNNGGQPSSIGASYIDLLDLGTARTLTLINGRRSVGSNAGTLFVFGNETGNQVDVNVIPTSLIERVDVLTVGGAVAYGSDAIAGVVNYIMKDDFDGIKVGTRVGQTDRGDGVDMSFRSTIGTNFAEDRGNVFAHAEYSHIDGIQGNKRSFRRDNPGTLTGFANGSLRNPNFMPAIIGANGANNGAFLRAADDGVPGNVNLPELSAANVSPGGVIFNVLTPAQLNLMGVTGQIGPFAQTFTVNNTQLIPGAPAACNPGRTATTQNLPVICAFAPAPANALPNGVTPAQVFSAFGVTPPPNLTGPQATLLAFNVIQANRPTAREFFAQNPNTPLNAFLGSFIAAFPDVANTDPATSGFLPRIARPLRFDNAGNIEEFTVASLMPDTPSSIGGAAGGEGFNNIFNTPLRVEQDRAIAFFGGHYDFNDNVTFFSENSYSKVDSTGLRGNASANNANSQTIENAALIINVNNPFLTDANRAALASVGITDNFVLSRTNQDIQGDSRTEGEVKTFRTVQGLKGSFEFLDRGVDWDASVLYGRSQAETSTRNIKDVEFALALDAVRDPATGNIVCRSQLDPTVIGKILPGVSENIVRQPGPDGILTESVFTPRVTAEQVAACRPLNPFGFGQMSADARNYVLGKQKTKNVSEQYGAQANITFPLVELPAGDLGFGAFFEYRKEEIDYTVDQLSAFGRTRTAALAATKGETETTELGAEVRVPIFGGEWQFPGMWGLDIGGGVRRTTQDGKAPTFRAQPPPGSPPGAVGALVRQDSSGDAQNITTLNFNYSPVESLRFRGERTRAIRQPNVVELFLGGQPAFNLPTDPCSNANIAGGPNPAARRANCIQAVIDAGVVPDAEQAAAFLQGFVARNTNLQGTFTGNPNLAPEKADSWTAGLVFAPTFLRGLRASADYISIDLANQIFPTNQTQALNFCFDSPQFPDNTASFGINTCSLTRREADSFQLTNGFTLGFLNLAATEIRSLNGTIEYTVGLSDLFKSKRNLGTLGLDYNHYHLFAFRESGTGNFDDTQESQGTALRPRNKSRLTASYVNGDWTVQATWNYFDHTRVLNGGVPANGDAFQVIKLPSYSLYDLSASYKINDKWRTNLTLVNALDKNTVGQNGLNLLLIDQVGRRFALTVTADF